MTHLSLQVLDLLLQEVVPLLFVYILSRLVADVGFQILQVNLTVQELHQREQPLLHVFHLQQPHFLFYAERHVRAYEVQGHDVVRDVFDGEGGLVGYFVAHVDIFRHHIPQILHGRTEFTVLLLRLNIVQGFHDTLQIGI